MQHYWSNDSRFSAERFGFQPTWLILQALEQGAKLHSEVLHHQELGIATLSALFCNANRDPKKGEPARPSDFWYFGKAEHSGVAIPGAVCDIFFSLIADQLLPTWALGIAPIELLRKHRANRPVSKPRAWIGSDLILIQPQVVEGKTVRAALAIVNGAAGGVELIDADSRTPFYLSLEAPGQIAWALDAEFERLVHE